jgi:hypothetical protein
VRQGIRLALLLVAAVALGACREEDGRVLGFDKGKYGGPPIAKSSEKAATGWRDHAEKMRF